MWIIYFQESPEILMFCQDFLFYQILNFLIQLAIKNEDIERAVLLFQVPLVMYLKLHIIVE